MTYYYTVYQLTLASELPLPELDEIEAMAAPDVEIVLAPVTLPPPAQALGPHLWADPQRLWLRIPEVAHFCVDDGRRITVAPAPGVDADSVRLFLLGSALGALLMQRHYLVLHGNAVAVDGQCLVCVGPSGAGKSTLAAALWQRGYPVLADDVVAINADGAALPGFPRIKLWQDSADHLQLPTTTLAAVRPGLAKFSQPLPPCDVAQPLPLRWVYLLEQHYRPDIVLTPVTGMARFPELSRNSYRPRFLEGLALKAVHLQQCARLSSHIRLVKVSRPRDGFLLDELVEHILADARAHP